MFLSSFLVETYRKVATAFAVLSFPQFNRTGIIPQKLVITRLADIKLVSKSYDNCFLGNSARKLVGIV